MINSGERRKRFTIYEKAMAEVVMFDSDDVITTSGSCTGSTSNVSWCGTSYVNGGCTMGSQVCDTWTSRGFSVLDVQD